LNLVALVNESKVVFSADWLVSCLASASIYRIITKEGSQLANGRTGKQAKKNVI